MITDQSLFYPQYRSLLRKVLKVIFFKYLNKFYLLYQFKSGFCPIHSTESAIFRIIDSWIKAINEGKIVGLVLVDFRKNFDLVDHRINMMRYSIFSDTIR